MAVASCHQSAATSLPDIYGLMALHQMAALLVRASADEAPVQVDDADIVDLDRVASESG